MEGETRRLKVKRAIKLENARIAQYVAVVFLDTAFFASNRQSTRVADTCKVD